MIFTSPFVFSSFNVSGGITHSFKTFGDCDAATNSNDSFAAIFDQAENDYLPKCIHSGRSGGSINVGLNLKRIQLSFNIYSPRRNITATIDGMGENGFLQRNEDSKLLLARSALLSLIETTNYSFNIGYPLSDHLVLGTGYTFVGLNFKASDTETAERNGNHDEGTSLFSGFITISSAINDTFTTYATANLGYSEIEKKADTVFFLTDLYLLSRNITFGISYNRGDAREMQSP